jgi:predicted enzyme related to lactoylglutathione lyase
MSDQLLGSFVWCELLTTDTAAAGNFYKKVVGWKTAPFGNDSSYTTFNTGAGPVGGMMTLPEDAKAMGAPPNWMMYVGTPDVDGTAAKIAELGGKVLRQPENIPNAGRFAVVQDPYGAAFGIYSPDKAGAPKGQPGVGDFSWFELYTPDPDGAWTFYSSLFGWEKTSAMDMGDMGVYQMFGRGGGVPNGGIMKPPPGAPAAWQPYAMVKDAKASAKAATAAGGKIINGPMEVPGGDWIAQGMDPQGAMFAVHSLKPAAAAAKPAAPKPAAAAKTAAPAKKAAPATKPAKAAKKSSAGAAKKSAKKAARKSAKKAAKKSARSAPRGAAKKASKKAAKKAAKKKGAKRSMRKK